MSVNEESNAFGMGQGCSVHGDEHMKECSMCGAEFCRICVPRSTVCPDCAEQSDDDDEEKDSSDFDDITRVGTVVEDADEEKEEKTEESTEDIVEEDREKD
jgi:hypothetical protein